MCAVSCAAKSLSPATWITPFFMAEATCSSFCNFFTHDFMISAADLDLGSPFVPYYGGLPMEIVLRMGSSFSLVMHEQVDILVD